MHQNLIFIGGIHGSGKGTICSKIEKELNIQHISASLILKWSEVSPSVSNKLVKDIADTQNRLIKGLSDAVRPNGKYVMDGHFNLFDSRGKVNKIPFETFYKIAPILIGVVVCDTEIIAKRLAARDKREYSPEVLSYMQDQEIKHAKKVSELLGVPFIKVNGDNITGLIDTIKDLHL